MKMVFLMAVMTVMASAAFATNETRYIGKTNSYGYLSCIQQTKSLSGAWENPTETSSSNCIIEHRYVTGEQKIVFDNCFEQGKAMTEDGSFKWFFVDFASRDSKLCLTDKSKSKFVSSEENGRFSCFEQALVLESRQDKSVSPVLKYVDFAVRDQKLCTSGIDRFVPSINNGMLNGCFQQSAVTLASGQVKWLAYDFASRDLKNCVLGEKCQQDSKTKRWYKKVAVNAVKADNIDNVTWIYFNYLSYADSKCGQ